MIQLENISFSRGKRLILDNISLSVNKGELVAILGPNGAGKSTLLQIMAGSLAQEKGKVLIKNKTIQSWKKADLAKIRSVLTQFTNMGASFNVEEVVMMGRYPHFNHAPAQVDKDIVSQAIQSVNAQNLAHRRIDQLSGGEQQRVHLARVLAQVWSDDPKEAEEKFLLLDEPVNNLDLRYQHEFLSIAKECSKKGSGVVAILHDLNLAARFADRIIILKDGVKWIDNTPEKALDPEQLTKIYDLPVEILRQGDQLIVAPMSSPAIPKKDKTESNQLIHA